MPTYAELQNADSIEVDDIRSTAAGAVDFSQGLKADVIAESSSAAGVTIDGVLLKDSLIGHSYLSIAPSSWTPSPGAVAGTFTGLSTPYAQEAKVGNLTYCSIRFTATQATADASYWSFTLPRASANLGTDQLMSCYIQMNYSTLSNITWFGGLYVVNNSTSARVYLGYESVAGGVFKVGGQFTFSANFFYKNA